ncbi:MAG: cell wall hydrolase [Eubacteriales bacterium]|nr:cell wall hydrolase [Eubacteriales bacterium]
MKHKQHKRLFICCICAILSFTFTMPYLSYATTQADYDANNRELESLRAQQNEINSDIARLNEQIDTVGNKLSSINDQIEKKQIEAAALKADIDALNVSISNQYSAMKLRIRYMYEHNDEDIIELLLTSKSLSEMLVRTEYVTQISDYDRNMLKQLNNTMLTQKNNKSRLENELSQLALLQSDAQTQISNLDSLLALAKAAYASNADDISKSEALALQYEQKLEEERIAREQAAIDNIGSNSNTVINGSPIEYTPTDLAMLAAIIECEAGNQPYDGLLAVGSVIVNRVNNPRFDNTITGVIYAPYQFSPVASGRFAIVLARGAAPRCVDAAKAVLAGNINTNALYFHAYNSSVDFGGTVIGDHVFY